MNADFGDSVGAGVSPCFGCFTTYTETICASGGHTPAIAWPVMIACVYSLRPNPEVKAKSPF